MNNSNLEFRKIKSLNYLYEINENGTIFRNVKSKKQSLIKLDYHHSKDGYYVTFVHLGGRSKDSRIVRCMIHRMVAECWLGDCPPGMEVDHKDRNTHNNDWRNLRYVTRSDQMKNRDHTNISRTGSINLERARRERAVSVRITGNNIDKVFSSKAECARWIGNYYGIDSESVRWKLKIGRSHVLDFDLIYLNAETRHGGSTEQGIVR